MKNSRAICMVELSSWVFEVFIMTKNYQNEKKNDRGKCCDCLLLATALNDIKGILPAFM